MKTQQTPTDQPHDTNGNGKEFVGVLLAELGLGRAANRSMLFFHAGMDWTVFVWCGNEPAAAAVRLGTGLGKAESVDRSLVPGNASARQFQWSRNCDWLQLSRAGETAI